MMRRIAERILRDRVVRRRLPAAFGRVPLYCSPAGGLKMLLSPMASTDPALLCLADRLVRRGDTVWDIGANIGLFSVAAAYKAGRQGQVYAFEPDAWLVQSLRRSAREQPETSAEITVVPAAVGGTTGLRRFAISSRARAMNSLAEYADERNGGELQTVMAIGPADLIDWVPPPHLVKIDVEGAELELLQAALPMLERFHPIVICEVWPQNRAEVTRILRGAGYTLHDADSAFQNAVDVPPSFAEAPWNTLAICGGLGDRPLHGSSP